MNRWKVITTGYDWAVLKLSKYGWWLYRDGFNTHAEALAYADHMARTREVVLPRLAVRPTSRHMVLENGLIIEWEHNSDFPNLPPKYLTVKPEERRPLALALLALAEQGEHE